MGTLIVVLGVFLGVGLASLMLGSYVVGRSADPEMAQVLRRRQVQREANGVKHD